MPWEVRTAMSERVRFCEAAQGEGVNLSRLCEQYGISRKTGYKWLKRYQSEGVCGLVEQSRRPHATPTRTEGEVEAAVVAVRKAHPRWGGRKIQRVLQDQGMAQAPHPSTVTAILRRHNLLDAEESAKHKPYMRFAHALPNQLWQMDFKGHFLLNDLIRCHPLTVLDDHSRYLLCLRACDNETRTTVQSALTALFQEYGMPDRMLADNGSPWGVGPELLRNQIDGTQQDDGTHSRRLHTGLTVWLLKYDIPVTHGRPAHPQTQGKDERIHRTLKEELLMQRSFANLADSQSAFDDWRSLYNHQRPHDALNLDVPAAHYQPSFRTFPARIPPVVYDEGVIVRKVDEQGRLTLQNQKWRIGRAFYGEQLALHPTAVDGVFDVCFCTHLICSINQNVRRNNT